MRAVNGRFTPRTLPIPEQDNNNLTSIPPGSISTLASLQNLRLVRVRLAPLSLPSIAQLGAFHSAVSTAASTPHALHIPEQINHKLTSIESGSVSGLTSLRDLYLVRGAPRAALASIYRSPRRVPPHHAPCQRPLHSPHPPHP